MELKRFPVLQSQQMGEGMGKGNRNRGKGKGGNGKREGRKKEDREGSTKGNLPPPKLHVLPDLKNICCTAIFCN